MKIEQKPLPGFGASTLKIEVKNGWKYTTSTLPNGHVQVKAEKAILDEKKA